MVLGFGVVSVLPVVGSSVCCCFLLYRRCGVAGIPPMQSTAINAMVALRCRSGMCDGSDETPRVSLACACMHSGVRAFVKASLEVKLTYYIVEYVTVLVMDCVTVVSAFLQPWRVFSIGTGGRKNMGRGTKFFFHLRKSAFSLLPEHLLYFLSTHSFCRGACTLCACFRLKVEQLVVNMSISKDCRVTLGALVLRSVGRYTLRGTRCHGWQTYLSP